MFKIIRAAITQQKYPKLLISGSAVSAILNSYKTAKLSLNTEISYLQKPNVEIFEMYETEYYDNKHKLLIAKLIFDNIMEKTKVWFTTNDNYGDDYSECGRDLLDFP